MLRSARIGLVDKKFLRRGLFGERETKNRLYEGVGRGFIEDLVEFRDRNGKRFIARNELCSVKEAVQFPIISGRNLSGKEMALPSRGQVQLVLMSMRQLGQKMCDLYRRSFEEALPDVAVYELSLVDQAVFRVFHKWMERNLLKLIPKERHCSFLCYTGAGSMSVKELTRSIQYGNSLVGHAILVDKNSLIRWRATAVPTEREIQAMIECTKQLLSSKKN